jgi:hypothetical protein
LLILVGANFSIIISFYLGGNCLREAELLLSAAGACIAEVIRLRQSLLARCCKDIELE